MHWYGKIVMFVELGYLRKENVLMFPGKARAAHAMSLLAPITMKSAESSVPEFVSEHEKGRLYFYDVYTCVKSLYGIFRL